MSTRGKLRAVATPSKKTGASADAPVDDEQIIAELRAILAWGVGVAATSDLRTFERELLPRLFALGALIVKRFIQGRAAALEPTLTGPRWRVPRSVGTVFGEVRFVRTYVRGDQGHGHAPLDRALGLTADFVSANLLGLSALLATQMPYDQVREVLRLFTAYVPSARIIKEAVLGFGALANEWLETMPIPKGDGEVLVALFDSKGVPTATEGELTKRRGKRKRRRKAASARHRGRDRRAGWAPKRRRKKGDKSKNARLCTVVLVYTLKRQGGLLLGPINPVRYASFGPKELAFQWAKRHAARRGFSPDSGKTIQIVTDGDDDLSVYTRRYFPNALHTLDVYHALEYVWQAGSSLYKEGSAELDAWYAKARKKVFGGRTAALLDELRAALRAIPKTGPGNKGRRGRLEQAIDYLAERLPMMQYKWLVDRDLEIGSGGIEGTVNHLVKLRFDHGGMRWIRERAQALLQLRCIHHNGDWDAFLAWALPRLASPTDERPVPRIQRVTPAPVPQLAEAA